MKRNTFAYGFLPIFLLLASCGGGGNHNVVSLSGEIKGLGNDTLYIYGTDRFFDRIDTLIATNDKFHDTLSVDTLVTAWIYFKDGTRVPLCMDKRDKITFKGTTEKLASLEVTGSLPNDELTAFRKELESLNLPTDSVPEQQIENFIRNHPASPTCIFLIDHYYVQKAHPDLARISELAALLTGDVKDHPYMEELLNDVEKHEKITLNKAMPFFQSNDKDGNKVNRTKFQQKHLLIHFWASWDETSRKANAEWKKLYKQEKKSEDFDMWGISLDIDKQAWLDAVEQDTLLWKQTCDLAGWEADAVEKTGISVLPANVLVNPQGRIKGIDVDADEVRKYLEQVRGKKPATSSRRLKRTGK